MSNSLTGRIWPPAVHGGDRVCLLVCLSFVLSVGSAALAEAQLPKTSMANAAQHRNESGWTASNQETPAKSDRGGVQSVMYQSQGSLSDGLPPPPANFGAPQSSSATPGYGGRAAEPGLPAMFTDQPRRIDASRTRASEQGRQGVLPPQENFEYSNANFDGYAQPTNRQPSSTSAQPAAQANNQPPSGRSGGDLRSVPQQRPAASDGDGSAAFRNDGRLVPSQVATGLPYVTPAPRRVGNFATRPINPAMFQLTAYQRTAPVNPPPTGVGDVARAQAALAEQQRQQQLARGQQPALVAQPSRPLLPVLPQFQNTAYANNVYNTAAYQQCAPNLNFPATGVVPGTYVPPAVTPNLTPNLYSSNNSGYRPLFSLGQENYNVLLGRGLIGQPTVYVPGQYIRNFFRYLSP